MTVTTLQTRSLASRVEPAIAFARQLLKDGDTERAHDAMRAALDAFLILGPVAPESQSIARALESFERQFNSECVQIHRNGDATCKIDADAAVAALRTAIGNAALSGDAVLLINIDAENHPPVIDFIFDGPGSFPDTWYIGDIVPIPFDELRVHWTRHTAGGRLDRTPNGVAFKLAGQREPQPDPPAVDALLQVLVEAERELRMAVADGKSALADLAQRVLDVIDADAPQREPADIAALLRGVYQGERGLELSCSETMPAIAVLRDRLAAALQRLCGLAQSRVAAGAQIDLAARYHSANRAVEIEAAFPRDGEDMAWRAAIAALEHVVDDLHGGSLARELDEEICMLSLTIPDAIGAAVDEWIPGFDALSDRSIQMLRLLRSGGQAPPEDIILPGVLESELERWLLEKLAGAPAVNAAHDLERGSTDSPRLEKALGQVRRGKPKKEICAPPYAAEIVLAFARSERGRNALGLDALSSKGIESLVGALTSEPPEYLECLRLLVKITRAASG